MTSPDKRALWAALGVYLVLTGLLVARVPLGATPDEGAHWQYIEFVANTGKLPVFAGQAPPAPGYEFHQPPLYYLLAAPFWKMLPSGLEQYAARLVSLVCGLFTIVLVWASARKIFPGRPAISSLATFFVALWPLHQSVGAASGNDALAGLICAALFFVGTRARIDGVTKQEAVAVGVLAGLGLLTKTTTLVVAFAAILALITSSEARTDPTNEPARTRAHQPLSPFRAAFLAVLIGLVIAAPILIRNTTLYGDPLALGAFRRAFAPEANPGLSAWLALGGSFVDYWRGMLWMILMTAWGFYGGPNTIITRTSPFVNGPRMPDVWLLPILLMCVFAPLVALWGWKRLDAESKLYFGRVARFFLGGLLLVAVVWLQFALNYLAGGQARYLHPALLPVAIMLGAGWVGAFRTEVQLRVASLAFGAILLLLTGLNIFVWQTLV